MKPYRLVPEDRGDDPKQHSTARFRIEAFRVGDPAPKGVGTLPVAALPLYPGEDYYLYRGKVRPAVVISVGGDEIDRALKLGERWQTARTLLVAPYYGGDADGSRGGWPAILVDRIRKAEYPQYVLDSLPDSSVQQSILRLDHLFAIGADPANYRLHRYRLSDDALAIVDEWVAWFVTGTLDTDSLLGMIRADLMSA